MGKKWIQDAGVAKQENFITIVSDVVDEHCNYLAMYVDKFDAGEFNQVVLDGLSLNKLLELRVFCEDYEVLATRGSIGEVFSWRRTTDAKLERGSNGDYIDQKHFLDINEKYDFSDKFDANGNVKLFTTVGGSYSLPLKGNYKRVKVRSYVDYDANGMAKVVDTRICSFEE